MVLIACDLVPDVICSGLCSFRYGCAPSGSRRGLRIFTKRVLHRAAFGFSCFDKCLSLTCVSQPGLTGWRGRYGCLCSEIRKRDLVSHSVDITDIQLGINRFDIQIFIRCSYQSGICPADLKFPGNHSRITGVIHQRHFHGIFVDLKVDGLCITIEINMFCLLLCVKMQLSTFICAVFKLKRCINRPI